MILVTVLEMLLLVLVAIALIYWLPYLIMGICILLAVWAVIMGRRNRV